MTHRLARFLFLTILACGCMAASSLFATAQDSPKAADKKEAKREPNKSVSQGSVATMDQEPSAPNKDQAAKPGDSRKAEDAPPPVPSPKLIEVPQDDATYTPRPKVVAVFVFTNGNRIESDDYLITKDAVFINKDGKKTRYPINTIDRAATTAANEARGVVIAFPRSKSEFNLDF